MKGLVTAAAAVAIALATACAAHAEPDGNHSVNVSIVNGVATVIVDGKQLYGAEAQPYIDAARAKHRLSK